MRMPAVRFRLLLLVITFTSAARADWTHLARDAQRSGGAAAGPCDLDAPLWVGGLTESEAPVLRSSPVIFADHVYVNVRRFSGDGLQVGNALVSIELDTGTRDWAAPLPADVDDSWSSPAVDERNRTVLLGVGSRLIAVDADSGDERWSTTLDRSIVNASPVVTNDLQSAGVPTNRALITDASGFGDSATLYAINIDAFDALENPFTPGEIVWIASLPGASGNSPAYDSGVVYVASTGGELVALDAAGGAEIWRRMVDPTGFFGGVSVRGGAVYGATYNFFGSGNNSRLYKLDAATGDTRWSVACERTDSIPLALGDGTVLLAAGIDGFGSAMKVQAFQDLEDDAVMRWDTAVDSDGALTVGGYTYHPVAADGKLYVGRAEAGALFSAYVELFVLDLSKTPADAGFVMDRRPGPAGSPAIAADGRLIAIGAAGVAAYPLAGCDVCPNDPSGVACDSDIAPEGGDCVVNNQDLGALLAAYLSVTGDAAYNPAADLAPRGAPDGRVDNLDLGELLADYLNRCDEAR